MKFIHGGILEAIKQFDHAFNPAKEDDSKLRKRFNRNEKDRSRDRKPKKKKEDKKEEKPKEATTPVPVQSFQLKMTGNGGNPCSLAMERIIKERQEKALLE